MANNIEFECINIIYFSLVFILLLFLDREREKQRDYNGKFIFIDMDVSDVNMLS